MKILMPRRSLFNAFMLFACALTHMAAQAPAPDSPEIEARAASIVSNMTLDEKVAYVGGMWFKTRAVPRLNLPSWVMSDGPYGARSNAGLPSTTYAAGIALAASWDPALAERVGAGIGRDARARGVHYMLGPGVNIYRSPRNGRNFEYFGEDPFLAAAIATRYIEGMQKQGVSATVKHYIGNNSEFLRHDLDTIVDERTAREIYLPAFEAAVKRADVGAVMDSYNLINGQHATQNSHFNNDILRTEWGFKSTLMSDWDATYDGVAAANGGPDIEMPTGKFMSLETLSAAVKAGTVKETTIDDKVRHILVTAIRFGWLDRPQLDSSISFVDPANDKVALDSARESIVLLKNTGGLLPLDKASVKSMLVVGPNALNGVAVGGGSAGVKPVHLIGPLEGIGAYQGDSGVVSYSRGLSTLAQYAAATDFSTAEQGGTKGLTVETFSNASLTGVPVRTVVQPHVNFKGTSWANMSAKHQVSRRSTGFYMAPTAGKYIVALQGAGEGTSNRVYIDGKLVINNWNSIVRAIQPHVTPQLAAGAHKVIVEEAAERTIGGRLALCIVAVDKVVDPTAVEMAAKSDVVVIAAGFDQDSESEGGDRTFALPFGQDELIDAIAAVNKKTIVAITSGGNVDSQGWIAGVPAVMQTWYGGQDGGTALGEALFGAVNPSGHLPATFERKAEDNPTFANYYPEGDSREIEYKEGLFVGYRGYEHNKVEPLFPFGYGLSYTTFAFSNLKVEANSGSVGAVVTFDVRNTGTRAGTEVAQVYVGEQHAAVTEPEKQLKGFERVMLQPGETKQVSIRLDARAFAYYKVEAKGWKIRPGSFNVMVGDSSVALPLHATVAISRDVAEQ